LKEEVAHNESHLRHLARVCCWLVVSIAGAGIYVLASNVWVALIGIATALAGFAAAGGVTMNWLDHVWHDLFDRLFLDRTPKCKRSGSRVSGEPMGTGWRVLLGVIGAVTVLVGAGVGADPNALLAACGVVIILLAAVGIFPFLFN
jgi:hypothetical protein